MSKRRDPEQDLERLLDDDGGEFAAIYRRLPHPEPPSRLDRAVLANAARAVHGKHTSRGQRWLLGFGSAAGIVLAAGIAWQVGKQLESHETRSDTNRSRQSVIPVQPISESPRPQKSEPAEAAATMADEELSAAPAAIKQESARQARSKLMSPPPAPAPAPPPPPPAAPPVLEQRPAETEPAARMPTTDEAQPFLEKKDSAPIEKDSAAAGAMRTQRRDQAAGNAEVMSAPKAAAEQSRVPSPNSSVKLRRNMHLAPQDWLAEIVRLKEAGRRQEAIENLRLFRRMHPDWQLSDELRRLAE
ncbi:MAG TPA: hypothetical protein VFN25_06460 [Dokdonella sp.]|uniref:hypothetical protein n=1 Tax=Dokdonella sp. TaxID=2291710 RepID=UPI002D7EE685|nr:hypothetical protein [Dokdonella sp.]HET9032531.1 hypothetical protein [Dokdonella sp.]